jgi:hypothetical protein
MNDGNVVSDVLNNLPGQQNLITFKDYFPTHKLCDYASRVHCNEIVN